MRAVDESNKLLDRNDDQNVRDKEEKKTEALPDVCRPQSVGSGANPAATTNDQTPR